jgi:hypothetical protein
LEARLADFDNDGVPEAMQACGFIKGTINRWPELQALGTSNDQIVHNPRFWPNFKPGADLSGHDCNPFFVRGADGRYHNISPALGFTEPLVSRGIAIADVDGDGRLDFVTANQWGTSYFFKNESPNPGAFLGLRLVQPKRQSAIGAEARVKLADGANWSPRSMAARAFRTSQPRHSFRFRKMRTIHAVPVEIKWRDRQGIVQQCALQLTPGWHTVRLGLDALAQHLPDSNGIGRSNNSGESRSGHRCRLCKIKERSSEDPGLQYDPSFLSEQEPQASALRAVVLYGPDDPLECSRPYFARVRTILGHARNCGSYSHRCFDPAGLDRRSRSKPRTPFRR